MSKPGATEPFLGGVIAGFVVWLVLILGGGTLLALLTRGLELADIWSWDSLATIILGCAVAALVTGLVFATPLALGDTPEATAPRPREHDRGPVGASDTAPGEAGRAVFLVFDSTNVVSFESLSSPEPRAAVEIAVEAVREAAAKIEGRFAFAGGAVTRHAVHELLENAERIQGGEAGSPLFDMAGSPEFAPFVVAAWTESADGLVNVHRQLSDALAVGYAGAIWMAGEYDRRGFLEGVRGRFGLTPGLGHAGGAPPDVDAAGPTTPAG